MIGRLQLTPRPTLAPAICGVCERAFQEGDKPWVDTLSQFDVGVVTFLTGRKYVCDSCAAEMAEKIGYVAPEVAASLSAQVEALIERVQELEDWDDDLRQLRRLLDKAAAERLEEEIDG